MVMSLNKANDELILGIAKTARDAGAIVEVESHETLGIGIVDVLRKITITYGTHSSNARVLNQLNKKEPN
jgi:hypothetical protein